MHRYASFAGAQRSQSATGILYIEESYSATRVFAGETRSDVSWTHWWWKNHGSLGKSSAVIFLTEILILFFITREYFFCLDPCKYV